MRQVWGLVQVAAAKLCLLGAPLVMPQIVQVRGVEQSASAQTCSWFAVFFFVVAVLLAPQRVHLPSAP